MSIEDDEDITLTDDQEDDELDRDSDFWGDDLNDDIVSEEEDENFYTDLGRDGFI